MSTYQKPEISKIAEPAEGVYAASGDNTSGVGTNVSWSLQEPDSPNHNPNNDPEPHWIRKYALTIPDRFRGKTLRGVFVFNGPLRHAGCHHVLEDKKTLVGSTLTFELNYPAGNRHYVWACCDPEYYPNAIQIISGSITSID